MALVLPSKSEVETRMTSSNESEMVSHGPSGSTKNKGKRPEHSKLSFVWMTKYLYLLWPINVHVNSCAKNFSVVLLPWPW
jgi:hypothetical protein